MWHSQLSFSLIFQFLKLNWSKEVINMSVILVTKQTVQSKLILVLIKYMLIKYMFSTPEFIVSQQWKLIDSVQHY